MAQENNQKRSITSFFRLANIFPFAFFILLIAGTAVFASLYVSNQEVGFLIGMIVYAIVMAVIYLVFAIYFYRKFNAVFVRGLYSKD